MPSKDQVAQAFIAEGRRRGISPRGIVICISTGLVESNLTVYANGKVPESLNLPHDAVGSDGMSVGPLQQQVRRGANGQWWWSDAATCMDPTSSAGLFYDRLARIDYNSPARSPGSYAQQIQQSAYPDRYDQRMAEAQSIYDRLSGGGKPMPDYGITKTMFGYNADSVGIGNSNGPRASTPYAVIHTQQAKATAIALAQFLINSANTSNPVAYNFSIDGQDTVLCVPVNEGPWAAADANNIGVHICIAGSFAEWSRGQWLDSVDDSGDGLSEDLAITRAAQALAAAHLEFGIPLEYAGSGGTSGWPPRPSGVVGHMDFGARGGGHHDPGAGFPFDELIKRTLGFLAGGGAPAPVVNLINAAAAVTPWIGSRITNGENPLPEGAWAEFENGHVYWKRGATAAYVIPHGGLFETYGAEYGWERGPLGYPTRPFDKVTGGAVQAFEGGVLLRQDGKDRGWYVHGAIGDAFRALGWETGRMGWPTSDEQNVPDTDNIVQHFEHGDLIWSPSGVVTQMKGSN